MKQHKSGIVKSLAVAVLWLSFVGGDPFLADTSPRQEPDGREILGKVDDNRISGNKIILSEMIIHGRRISRSVRLKSWIKGTEESFSEYLEPPRERGIKMLKLGDQLWTYYPSTDRTILISGHMLRQSVMGSDLSYEDMMEDPVLLNSYEAVVTGDETVLDRPCWKLALTALKSDLAYHSRTIWVDKDRFVILKEERYARSGRLLKTTDIVSVIRIESRWIPDKMIFKDALKEGKGTEFLIESIAFDADIPEYLFSKASLKK